MTIKELKGLAKELEGKEAFFVKVKRSWDLECVDCEVDYRFTNSKGITTNCHFCRKGFQLSHEIEATSVEIRNLIIKACLVDESFPSISDLFDTPEEALLGYRKDLPF